MSTRATRLVLLAMLAVSAAGCHRKEFIRNRSVAMDPPLVSTDPALTDPLAAEPRRATFVDRHPLLRKPVEYYQSGGTNPLGRVAAATVVGVPAGILGEIRQIVVGCPPGF